MRLASHMFEVVRDTAEKIGVLEAQMWIYTYLANLPATTTPRHAGTGR